MANIAHVQYHLSALQIEFSSKIFQSANIYVAQIQYIICEYVILPVTL